MLQETDAVRNLQYDVEIRSVQRIETSVTQRPLSQTANTKRNAPEPPSNVLQSPRLPLPVSIVENIGVNRTFIPKTGYDFLTDLPSVHIEQTLALDDSHVAISAENRYIVRSPLGNAIYAANESATEKSILCGTSRPYQLHLLDQTHQEAMVYRKKSNLGFFCGQPTKLEVWIPPGDLLGIVVQSPTFFQPEFFIEDGNQQPLFVVEGPKNSGFFCFCLPKESFFKVHSGGDLRASIDHKWLSNKCQYTTNVYFSDPTLTAKERALILGTAFLLEYQYFKS